MISDLDIYRTANILVKQHERAGRADCARDRLYRWPATELKQQPAATAILHPQDSAKSHKKRT